MRTGWTILSWLFVLTTTVFFPRCTVANCQEQKRLETIENSIGVRLVKILPGEFLMGSPQNELGRFECERQHLVRITKPFWLGVEEVTVDQYNQVLNRTVENVPDGNLPEHYVSWHDAEAFCRKLSELESEKSAGRSYRLPTEAEWEYACRAGTQSAYFWGDTPKDADDFAWSLLNSERQNKRVGSRKPNPWGLHDMSGNLWEWCSDWYEELPSEEQTDPQGPTSGEQKVVRGGAMDSSAGYIRSASRAPARPSFFRPNEGVNIGFRVVMVELETQPGDPGKK